MNYADLYADALWDLDENEPYRQMHTPSAELLGLSPALDYVQAEMIGFELQGIPEEAREAWLAAVRSELASLDLDTLDDDTVRDIIERASVRIKQGWRLSS